jgi:predicted RNase H-like HicB family nuclease
MTRFGYYWTFSRSKQDKAFLVEVPELPGCMADGETRESWFNA